MRTVVALLMVVAAVAAMAAPKAFIVRPSPTHESISFVHQIPASRRHLPKTTPMPRAELEIVQGDGGFIGEVLDSNSTSVTLVDPDEDDLRDLQLLAEDVDDNQRERRKRSIVNFDPNSPSLKTVDSKSLLPEGEPLSMRVADDRKERYGDVMDEEANSEGEDDGERRRRAKRDVSHDLLVQRLLEAFEPMLHSVEVGPEKRESFRQKRGIVEEKEEEKADTINELDMTQPLEIDFPSSDRVTDKKAKVDLVAQQLGQRQQDADKLTREDIRELASKTDLSEVLNWLEALSEGREQDVAASLLAAKAKWKSTNGTHPNPEAEATKQEFKVNKIALKTDNTTNLNDIKSQHAKNKVSLVELTTEDAETSATASSTPRPEDSRSTSERPHKEGKKHKKQRRKRRRGQSNDTQKAEAKAESADS